MRAPHAHERPYVISSVYYDPSVLPTDKYTLCSQDGAIANDHEQCREYMLEAVNVMEYEKNILLFSQTVLINSPFQSIFGYCI